MAKLKSFVERVGPEGTVTTECFTCAHCNTIHEVPKGKGSEFGFCLKCMHPVCVPCGNQGCTPFEKKIEAYEKRMAMLKQMEV